MGGASSKNTANLVSAAITDVLIKNAQNCNVNVSATQTVDFSGTNISGNVVSQQVNAKLSCIQNVKIDNNIAGQIAAAIKQAAQANSELFNKANAENTANVTNIIRTNLKNETIQQCAVSIKAAQDVSFSGKNIKYNTVEQGINAFIECLQSTDAVTKITNEVSSEVGQSATAKSNFLPDIPTGVIILIALIIIVIVAAIITAAVYKKYKSKPEEKAEIVA